MSEERDTGAHPPLLTDEGYLPTCRVCGYDASATLLAGMNACPECGAYVDLESTGPCAGVSPGKKVALRYVLAAWLFPLAVLVTLPVVAPGVSLRASGGGIVVIAISVLILATGACRAAPRVRRLTWSQLEATALAKAGDIIATLVWMSLLWLVGGACIIVAIV